MLKKAGFNCLFEDDKWFLFCIAFVKYLLMVMNVL